MGEDNRICRLHRYDYRAIDMQIDNSPGDAILHRGTE